jgi:hypothetical protein
MAMVKHILLLHVYMYKLYAIIKIQNLTWKVFFMIQFKYTDIYIVHHFHHISKSYYFNREKSLVIQTLLETCQIDMYMDTYTSKH